MRRLPGMYPCAVAVTSLVLSAGALACSSEGRGEELDTEEVFQTRQSVVGGTALATNPHAAAILRKSVTERPGEWYTSCSGTVLKRTSTQSWVLTARHCITTDGKIPGPLLSASDLKVTTEVAPGAWVEPDTGSTVFDRVAMPTSTTDIGADLAILRVVGQLPLAGSGRIGVNVGPTSAVLGSSVSVMAYGPYVMDDFDTAGTLRSASGFPVLSDNGRTFLHGSTGSGGQGFDHGDSGGTIYRTSAWGRSGTWNTLYGVHSTYGNGGYLNPSVAGNWAWIQAQLGGVFISQAGALSTNLGSVMTPPSVNSPLRNGYTGNSSRTRWTYEPVAGTLTLGGLCAYGSGSSITLKTCASSDAYRWDLLPNGGYVRIRNRSLGTCITNATTPTLATCGTSSLAAVFHTEP